MKGNNQNNYDKRPKRRKDKLNPYTLYSIGADTDNPHYYVSFVDANNKKISVEVVKEVFDAFEQFELDDLSYLNEVSNHYEHSDISESTLNKRAIEVGISLEDIVFEKLDAEKLAKAITVLTEKQKRRLFLYFYKEMKYKEIALMEGCREQSVNDSISQALKKIKKIFEST